MTGSTPRTRERGATPAGLGGPIRRVSSLQVQEGEDGRLAVELATTGRVGTFQGVAIDFTHPDLPPAEWSARPWWHVWGDGHHHCGLIFPGEASVPAAEWEAVKGGVARPAIYAKPGDRVAIARVLQADVVSFLHHSHDYSTRLAFLTLTRADGSTVDDVGPLAFFGNTRLIGHGSREAFDNAIARIAALSPVGLRRGDDFHGAPWANGPDAAALHYGGQAHDGLFAMLDALDPDDGPKRAQLKDLVNAALLAGFALAKHEAQRAERLAGAIETNRQLATAARVIPEREQYARLLWNECPTWTPNRVAVLMMERWPEIFGDDEKSSLARSIKKYRPNTGV